MYAKYILVYAKLFLNHIRAFNRLFMQNTVSQKKKLTSDWERRSCETQLASFVEDFARKSSQGKQTDLILLDFSKAFDKVNHSKLILKLHSYGIMGSTLHWIQAYLSNRQQRVVVEGEESDPVAVTAGVPQGSVLVPILFLAYINDLPQDIVPQVRLLVDDTAIYLTVESKTDSDCLKRDLDRLQAWKSKWDMEFNSSKCLVSM